MDKRKRRLLCMLEGRKKYKWIRGAPPLSFKALAAGTLENYRIYGNTVGGESVGDLVESGEHAGEYKVPVTVEGKNLFDMKKFAETAYPTNATINYSGNSLIFTATKNDAYVNEVYSQSVMPSVVMPACINVQPLTAYTITMNSPYKCYISFLNDSGHPVHSYTIIPDDQSSYTFTTPEDCTKLLFRLGKYVTNIGDTFTISNIMLNSGSIPLPYEPYHAPVTVPIYLPESIKMVGDEAEYIDYAEQKMHRVRKNLLNEEYIQGNPISNSIIRVKCKTPIPLVKGELYTISFDSGSLFDVSLGSSPTPEYPFAADTTILSYCGNSLNWLTSPYTFECVNDGYISVTIRKKDNASITPDEVNFAIQFEKNSTATSYEPYIENTEVDVTLPALPTIKGTNVLSVGTTVQPSKIEVKGKIKAL